jgi:hypothetical protein
VRRCLLKFFGLVVTTIWASRCRQSVVLITGLTNETLSSFFCFEITSSGGQSFSFVNSTFKSRVLSTKIIRFSSSSPLNTESTITKDMLPYTFAEHGKHRNDINKRRFFLKKTAFAINIDKFTGFGCRLLMINKVNEIYARRLCNNKKTSAAWHSFLNKYHRIDAILRGYFWSVLAVFTTS